MTSRFSGLNRLLGCETGCFDAHAHVFSRDLPMAEGRRYTPVADATTDSFVGHLSSHELDGALLVQPSFLGSDNRFLVESLAHLSATSSDMVFRGVAVIEPDTPASRLLSLAEAGVIGCRLNLVGAESNFDFGQWRKTLSTVDQIGWHVELHCRAAALSLLLKELRQVAATIVVDHFGLPNTGLNHQGVSALTDQPPAGLLVKLSAPYRIFKDDDSTELGLKCSPWVQQLAEHFGCDQLMWGSDWPWTQFEGRHTYADTVRWHHEWLQAISSGYK